MNCKERGKIRGLPKARADIYLAAAATILHWPSIWRRTFHHSFFNLRFGIARILFS